MRKIFIYSAIALVSIALNSSCTATTPLEGENPAVTFTPQTITANANSTKTKISFNENGDKSIDLAWEEGDSFSVYEPNGKWMADFKLASADLSTFESVSGSSELVDGTDYVAVYPARPNGEATYAEYMDHDFTASQSATAETLEHLNNSCQMKGAFTWNTDAVVNFDHLNAILLVQFDDIPAGETPTEVTFSDGINKNYTLTLSGMKASTGVDGKADKECMYTANLMIKPSEAVARELTFTVTHTAGVNIYNNKTEKGYEDGVRYLAPIMNLNEQQDKGYWLSIGTATDLTTYLADPKTNAILTADIDMAGVNYNPTKYLAKVLDGNGHTISNLTLEAEKDGIGMFAGINGTGVVKNLKLANPKISTSTKSYAGAFAGKLMSGAQIVNCTVEGGEISATKFAGGIAGNSAGGKITNCRFKGTVTATSAVNAGGIVAATVVNDCPATEISGCEVDATITAATNNAGGIVGSGVSTIITNCKASGTVKTSGTGTAIGGIIGADTSNPTIYGCVNNATIEGVTKVGGIAGSFASSGTIVACYNLGTIGKADLTTGSTAGIIGEAKGTVDVTGCYNYSTFGKQPNNGNIGQITGYVKAAGAVVNVTDCYYVNQGTGNSVNGEVCTDIAALNEKVENMNTAIEATPYNSYIFVKGVDADNTPTLIEK